MNFSTHSRRRKAISGRPRRPGVILLVVLTSLTFFSLLVVSYFVFSTQQQQSAYAMNVRTTRAPDVNAFIETALMKFLRGTSDGQDPFFGEGLMDDYWGHDGVDMQVHPSEPPVDLIGGFVKFSAHLPLPNPLPNPPPTGDAQRPIRANLSDVLANRLITFTEGPLRHRTFRVIRSIFRTPGANPPANRNYNYDDLYIEIQQDDWNRVTTNLQQLFYQTFANGSTRPYQFYVNGVPQNSPGLGYVASSDNLDATMTTSGLSQNAGFNDLPVSLQPNHHPRLGPVPDKSATPGDFDEDYDAPDALNWFLSYRHPDGTVIPSFHRPSVLNYILNEEDWSNIPSDATGLQMLQNVMASLSRATMRPVPIATKQFAANGPDSLAVHPRFTGGSTNFALRTPLPLIIENPPNSGQFEPAPSAAARLHQLAKALIEDFDVDNDGDGQKDSNFIDIGLPMFTSKEGKLLRPLVAPMIEDLSARLDINAIGNPYLSSTIAGTNGSVLWAGTTGTVFDSTNARRVFRGIGYGPAEMSLPAVRSIGSSPMTGNVLNDISRLVQSRYGADGFPGSDLRTPAQNAADALDIIRSGWRPRLHNGLVGYGRSLDPFGRGGVALGRSGDIVASSSGTVIQEPTQQSLNVSYVDEATNDPYEFDPTGLLSGDNPFTLEELEAILRFDDFDSELLPDSLRTHLITLLNAAPEFSRSLTTSSRSSDRPAVFGQQNAFLTLAVTLSNSLNDAQVRELIAPDLRLGRKLDVNRAIGNGVDDNANNIVDEPLEDVPTQPAFAVAAGSAQALPARYQSIQGNYTFDSTTATSGRELLARNIYVLLSILTSNAAEFPSSGLTQFDAVTAAAFKSRRLAQWAVNLVDYRDPDSIMTRFEFDPNPLDGWAVPGGSPASAEFVVWGVEQPNLLFSEGLALHDTRLRDTSDDDVGSDDKSGDDANSDQVRRPEGSLFLELYCPHPTLNSNGTIDNQPSISNFPQEVFNATGELVLDGRAPARQGNPGGPRVPIWRIAFSEPHFQGQKQSSSPSVLRNADPDLTAYSPETRQLREIDQPLATNDPNFIGLERFAFFGEYSAAEILALKTEVGDMTPTNDVFFAPSQDLRENTPLNASRLLSPGQFLAIAPRETTHLGSQEYMGTFPGIPSPQRFSVDVTAGLVHADVAGNRQTPVLASAGASFTEALPLILATYRPTNSWTVNAFEDGYVGLNVSEPLVSSYYTPPAMERRYNGTQDVDSANGVDYVLTDAYLDQADAGSSPARDEPADLAIGVLPVDPSGDEPQLGTINNYCSAYLQRLADPTRPYHSITNPYRTVDWMSIDLTVFNGEDRDSKINENPGTYAKSTRQRSGAVRQRDNTGALIASIASANSLYSLETDILANASLDALNPAYFAFSAPVPYLENSLSFLNTQTPNNAGPNPTFVGFSASYGSFGNANVTGHDRNLPQTAYAIHPWLNRPFASELELLMVPACSQARLLEEFSFVPSAVDPNVYPTAMPLDPIIASGQFRHLLNFFHSSEMDNESFQLARLFDYVGTLPRFRGEIEPVVPSRLAPLPNPSPQQANITNANAFRSNLDELLAPPFNFRYDNSRVGRVNLNTLATFPVWAGLMQGHLTQTEFQNALASGNPNQLSYTEFLRNRRGYPVAPSMPAPPIRDVRGPRPYNYAPTKFDDRFPTQFAGVYRKAVNAIYAPRSLDRDYDADAIDEHEFTRRRGVEGTVLRALGGVDPENPPSQSMFVRSVNAAPQNAYQNRQRNPFIRYQTLMRMPNLVSDNSQVFLIRMTMGFFEVDAGDTSSLGREYNAELGLNQRYRAMFIVDRSKPVGFKPGEDMNVRDAVVYESYDQ